VQPFGEILRAAWRSCEELRVVQEQDRVVFGWKEKGKGCVAAVVQSSSEAVGVVAATKPGILLLHFVGGFRGLDTKQCAPFGLSLIHKGLGFCHVKHLY